MEASALLHQEWQLHRTRWKLLRGELLTQRRIGEFLEKYLPVKYFEDLRVPLYVSATDLEHGGQRIFSAGEQRFLLTAVARVGGLNPEALEPAVAKLERVLMRDAWIDFT